MKTQHLTSPEREFLELVTRAVFANHFSEERTRVDLEISGLRPSVSREEILNAVVSRVRSFLSGPGSADRSNLGAFSGHDRELLENAHLFDVFHRFIGEFDGLIEKQINTEDALCPVSFASEAIGMLTERGFCRNAAGRFFALFYQLRRAYYFIDCSLVGRSPSMRRVRQALWNNVFTHDIGLYQRHLQNRMEDFSTLLMGETGTGKGVAAAAIGRSGFVPFDLKRRVFPVNFMRSFISINLSQYSEALIESELFGHRKGAFTGAVEAHQGVFSRCSRHGAIFLDEITDVSIPIQIKLLQVIQTREFSPVGSHEKCRFEGRVIAAGNRPIGELRREGLFRDDFFYRLCSDEIVIPPLRDRIREDPGELDDLLALTVSRIVGQESEELLHLVKTVIVAEPGIHYRWPGNVRELEQCVRRILLTRRYRGDHRSAAPDLRKQIRDGIDAGTTTARDLLADYCSLLYQRHGTYEEVARRTGLDRRTVKKNVQAPVRALDSSEVPAVPGG